ncbi:DUF7002 family protein [Xanthomonas campestris]|uniref:DUF7002 family protein n=1 Tax=Xanthomonas campestris TaxID=339 RepID=UPI0008D9924F|nr:hypothetical protein [Xanthomonas campestris]OHX22512.1 hypothetical protein BHL63_08495 [Xanthomonas alfalfae]WDJ52545.1 hypothetical protein JH293_04700 [Xanthomonas campestris pv. campestris]
MDLSKLIDRYPRVYHMAQAGSWPSIQARGLFSTTGALDALSVEGDRRNHFEAEHRPEMTSLRPHSPDDIVLRDQKPMPPGRLAHALPAHVTPEQWYRLINGKVFFWAERERLLRLLNSYGEFEHDVLTVDTASLLAAHAENTWLCHMNSGNTWPIPHRRDVDIFRRIADYPARASGAPVKEVVELVIDHAVPDIADHVIAVTRMKGEVEIRTIR